MEPHLMVPRAALNRRRGWLAELTPWASKLCWNMLELAAFEPERRVRNGDVYELQFGEFVMSISKLAEAVDMSRPTVRQALHDLGPNGARFVIWKPLPGHETGRDAKMLFALVQPERWLFLGRNGRSNGTEELTGNQQPSLWADETSGSAHELETRFPDNGHGDAELVAALPVMGGKGVRKSETGNETGNVSGNAVRASTSRAYGSGEKRDLEQVTSRDVTSVPPDPTTTSPPNLVPFVTSGQAGQSGQDIGQVSDRDSRGQQQSGNGQVSKSGLQAQELKDVAQCLHADWPTVGLSTRLPQLPWSDKQPAVPGQYPDFEPMLPFLLPFVDAVLDPGLIARLRREHQGSWGEQLMCIGKELHSVLVALHRDDYIAGRSNGSKKHGPMSLRRIAVGKGGNRAHFVEAVLKRQYAPNDERFSPGPKEVPRPEPAADEPHEDEEMRCYFNGAPELPDEVVQP